MEKYSRKCRREVPRRLSSNCRRFGTHCRFHLHRHLPMKMEPAVSSETSAIRTPTPGNYPKRNKLLLEHGESLKKNTCFLVKSYVIALWHHHEKALQLKACSALNFFLSQSDLFYLNILSVEGYCCTSSHSVIRHTQTHTHSLYFSFSVGPLWKREGRRAESCTFAKNNIHTRETAMPRRDSKPQFQQVRGFRTFLLCFLSTGSL